MDNAESGSHLKEFFDNIENKDRFLRIDGDTRVFDIVKAHLSGYEVLPISSNSCEAFDMSMVEIEEELMKFGEKLGLVELVRRIEIHVKERVGIHSIIKCPLIGLQPGFARIISFLLQSFKCRE